MAKKVLSCIPMFSERCNRALEYLKENGFEVILYDGDTVMEAEEIRNAGKEICGAIAGCEEWSEKVLASCPNLKVLARFGVGVDCIDLEAAKRFGIKVCNAKRMNRASVGETTVMFALACLRNLVELTKTTKEGKWVRYTGRNLKGKVYGLVGFGAIAQYVAKLLQSFGVKEIIAYDPFQNKEAAELLNVRFVDFETLLKGSDVISLHIPCTDQTIDLFGEEELRSMKESAVLVNVARGPIVNQNALYKALKEGWIGAAAVDVFTEEPTPKDNPLLTLDNLICMPHQAADTYETFDEIGYFDAKVIVDTMNGKEPQNWLNP